DSSLRLRGRRAGHVAWAGRRRVGDRRGAAARAARLQGRESRRDGPPPPAGTILAVHVSVGETVSAGQPVLVVEAMKMEHTVTAPLDGVVTELTAKAGQQVPMDETLAVIAAEPTDGGSLGAP